MHISELQKKMFSSVRLLWNVLLLNEVYEAQYLKRYKGQRTLRHTTVDRTKQKQN